MRCPEVLDGKSMLQCTQDASDHMAKVDSAGKLLIVHTWAGVVGDQPVGGKWFTYA